MAAVFQELEISWGGEVYRVKPTMRILNEIEQSVSISSIAYRVSKGEPPISLMSHVLAIFLKHAGANVDEEDIYLELMGGNTEAVQQLAQLIVLSAYPQMGKLEGKKMPVTTKKKTRATKS